jgi:hypothetical protein
LHSFEPKIIDVSPQSGRRRGERLFERGLKRMRIARLANERRNVKPPKSVRRGRSLPLESPNTSRKSQFLPDNGCRIEFAVTSSKQRSDAKSTRHYRAMFVSRLSCAPISPAGGFERQLCHDPSTQPGTPRWTHHPVTHSKQSVGVEAARNFIPTLRPSPIPNGNLSRGEV